MFSLHGHLINPYECLCSLFQSIHIASMTLLFCLLLCGVTELLAMVCLVYCSLNSQRIPFVFHYLFLWQSGCFTISLVGSITYVYLVSTPQSLVIFPFSVSTLMDNSSSFLLYSSGLGVLAAQNLWNAFFVFCLFKKKNTICGFPTSSLQDDEDMVFVMKSLNAESMYTIEPHPHFHHADLSYTNLFDEGMPLLPRNTLTYKSYI